MFGSQQFRLAIFASIAWLVLDAIAAWLLAGYFTSSYGSRSESFLILLALLYGAGLILWLRKTLWGWITFLAWGRKAAGPAIASNLMGRGLPPPRAYETSPEGYLLNVMEDEGERLETRLAAAVELGGLRYPAQAGRWLETIRLHMVYEDALTQMRLHSGRDAEDEPVLA